jgi:hypothetical protein
MRESKEGKKMSSKFQQMLQIELTNFYVWCVGL